MTAKRILVPIDGSEHSEEVVPLVAAIARDTGATVRLLRVYPIPRRVVRDDGEVIAYADQEMAGLTAAGEHALEHASIRLHDVPVERVVRFGNTVDEIANEAEAFDADVIVLTERPRTPWRRLVAKGVAGGVADRSTVRVLLLRARS